MGSFNNTTTFKEYQATLELKRKVQRENDIQYQYSKLETAYKVVNS